MGGHAAPPLYITMCRTGFTSIDSSEERFPEGVPQNWQQQLFWLLHSLPALRSVPVSLQLIIDFSGERFPEGVPQNWQQELFWLLYSLPACILPWRLPFMKSCPNRRLGASWRLPFMKRNP